MQSSPAPHIAVDALKLAFDGTPLLEDFSLRVQPGEAIILTGPSGCGKSSLLRCILGFLQPQAGEIKVRGERLSADSVWRIRRQVAYVPQEPEPGQGKVGEILRRPFSYRANSHLDFSIETALELFDSLGLPRTLLGKQIEELSGGEKQRVTIVASLLLQRKIILLDEPASALDGVAAAAVARQLRSRKNLTVLAACHHPEDLALDGRVIELGRRT